MALTSCSREQTRSELFTGKGSDDKDHLQSLIGRIRGAAITGQGKITKILRC